MTDIAKRADIIIGVKSAYEKTGVYVNAMRRLHLSQPLVESDLPDDWEVLKELTNKLGGDFKHETSEQVWDEVTKVAPKRFSGAQYYRLARHRKRGMQWPVYLEDTPILHLLDFRTDDGLGKYVYKLNVKYTNKVKPRTLFTTFHHARSKINAIFGDEADELIM